MSGLRTLTRLEGAWARGAFGAIFPSGGPMKPIKIGICDLDLEAFLIDVRSRAPFKSALGVRLAIWIVALAPLFVLGRFRTITGIDQASREVVVAALLASPIYAVRQLTMLLKAIGALLFASAPAVRAVMTPNWVRARTVDESGPTVRLVQLGTTKGESDERRSA